MASLNQPHRMRNKAVADAVAGAAASLISLWVFYPVDVWKTKIQASPSTKCGASTLDRLALMKWHEFFAGWQVKSLHTASSSFCYFYLYSWIFSWWKRSSLGRGASGSPSVPVRLLLAAIAAMMNTCLTLPLDVLSSRHQHGSCRSRKALQNQQTSIESESTYDNSEEKKEESVDSEEEETYNTCKTPLNETVGSGRKSSLVDLKSYWKGLAPSLLLCSNPSIHYTVFDFAKANLLQRTASKDLSMTEAFVLGMLAKFSATIVTYPLIRVKMILMVTPLEGLWKCLIQEYNEHGINGLYKGCRLQLFHSLMKSALLMMARERITRAARKALLKS